MKDNRLETTINFPDTEVTIDGIVYSVDGTVDILFGWEDFGIGSYEYWGQRGYDSQMGAEEVEIIKLIITVLCSDQDDFTDEIVPSENLLKQIMANLNDQLDEGKSEFSKYIYERAVPDQQEEVEYEPEWDMCTDPNWMNP